MQSNVWNSRYLATYSDASSNGALKVTISDALQLWYKNGLEAITFRDDCRGPHCNSECPEAFDLGDLTSNNWPTWSKVLIVSVIVAVGVFAVVMKLLFVIWLWWVERKQVLYLESLDSNCEGESNKLQVRCFAYMFMFPLDTQQRKTMHTVAFVVLFSCLIALQL